MSDSSLYGNSSNDNASGDYEYSGNHSDNSLFVYSDTNGNGVNHGDLYASKRHYDEFEPFAQPLPASGEPLFPSASFPSDYPSLRTPERPIDETVNQPTDHTGLDHSFDSAGIDQKSAEDQKGFDQSAYVQGAFDQNTYAQAQTNQSYQSYKNQYEVSDNLIYGVVAEPTLDQPSSWQGTPSSTGSGEDPQPAMEIRPASSAASLPQVITTAPPALPVEAPAADVKPPLSDRELLFNRHMIVLTDLMQHGAWPQALERIKMMRSEYPRVKALVHLQDEATLKTELMAQWTHKVKGRRLTVAQEWLIRRSLPFLLLLALFISGATFYRTFVAPSRQVMAMERENQALIEEAMGMVQKGQIDQAVERYNIVLTRNPNNTLAKQGLEEAGRLSGLSVIYDVAIRVANRGNLERSLLMLQTIKAKSPLFRDVDARIQRVNTLLEAERVFKLGEKSFAQRRWLDAIAYYQDTQELAEDYQPLRVATQITASYFMASQRLMNQWPTGEFGPEQIREFLVKSQEVNGQDETTLTFLEQLDDFIRGERSLRNENVGQAIETWRKLFDEQPAFLGGYLAEELYRAYLTLAAEVRAADQTYAIELYTLAAQMPVRDSNEARVQLQALGAPIPPPQPMITPQPLTRPPSGSTGPASTGSVAAAPAAMAEPASTPAPQAAVASAPSEYSGWIAFRSTRDGTVQIYMMRADGSEQQLASDAIRVRFDAFYQEEQRGPDGRAILVQSEVGRADRNLYISDGAGGNVTSLTNYNGDEYDPVWSSATDHIAFVASHTGNDEIWVMRADGFDQRQLTFNDWEWDKHPTWSPDGSQIAFFSNRSGQRQIWAMNSDGSNQHNLSNNAFDDWDPVWLK